MIEVAVAQLFGCQPVIQKILMWVPGGAICYCFHEQGTWLTLTPVTPAVTLFGDYEATPVVEQETSLTPPV